MTPCRRTLWSIAVLIQALMAGVLTAEGAQKTAEEGSQSHFLRLAKDTNDSPVALEAPCGCERLSVGTALEMLAAGQT